MRVQGQHTICEKMWYRLKKHRLTKMRLQIVSGNLKPHAVKIVAHMCLHITLTAFF